MKPQWIEDDKGWYVTKDSDKHTSGYEIIRGPFGSEQAALAGLKKYATTGEWPGKKIDTEQDV